MKKIAKYAPPKEPLIIGTMRFVSQSAAIRALGDSAFKFAEIGEPAVGKNETAFVQDGRFFLKVLA